MKKQLINFRSFIIVMVLMCLTYKNAKADDALITYIQHDGFIIEADSLVIYIDITLNPGTSYPAPDLIFITHDHMDHFSPSVITSLANSSGATVIGPQSVISSLSSLPGNQLSEYTPATGAKTTGSILGVNLTVYGTDEPGNSYRFEFPSGVVIYHNGDMTDTRFGNFVTSGSNELLNMNVAMLDSWAHIPANFNSSYNPDIMIEMHNYSSPCVVFTNYPTSSSLSSGNSYTYTYSGNSGTDSHKLYKDFELYPNPCSGIFYVRSETNQKANIKIYNTVGKIIYESEIKNEEINLSSFTKGIYFLELETEQKTFSTKLIVI